MARQFSTNDRMLRYRRIQSYFFTDTIFVTAKSTRGNKVMQLFVSDKGYIAVYPMESKSDFKDCLHLFGKEVGVSLARVWQVQGQRLSPMVDVRGVEPHCPITLEPFADPSLLSDGCVYDRGSVTEWLRTHKSIDWACAPISRTDT